MPPASGSVRVDVWVSEEELAALEAAREARGAQGRASFLRRMWKEWLEAGGFPTRIPVADPATAAPKGMTVLGAAEELARVEAELEAKRAEGQV
jgi:hypothetical protein